MGIGQQKWVEVRQQLRGELVAHPELYGPTLVKKSVDYYLEGLKWDGK